MRFVPPTVAVFFVAAWALAGAPMQAAAAGRLRRRLLP